MAFFDLIDMTVAYVQYLYILLFISSSSFPSFYVEPFLSLHYVARELFRKMEDGGSENNLVELKLPTWIPLDIRLQFALIAIGVPLLVSLLGVLIVCSSSFFGWTLLTLVSFFAMVFGATTLDQRWIYAEERLSVKTRVLLVIIGSICTALLFALVVYGFLSWRARAHKAEEEELLKDAPSETDTQTKGISLAEKAVMRSATNRRALAAVAAYEAEKMRYLERRHCNFLVPHTLLGLVVLLGGCILLGAPPLESIHFLQVSPLGCGIGITCIVIASLAFVWVVLGVFRQGRQLHVKLYDFLSSTILGIMVITISIIYVPVLMNIINILFCTTVSCNAGEHLVSPGSISRAVVNLNSWDLSHAGCYACNFSTHVQKCSEKIQQELCGLPVVEERLAYDKSVRCSDVDLFYKLALSVIMLAYIVAYPIFLVIVTDRATKILEKEYPLEKRVCDEFTGEELYYEKVRMSSNVLAPIYQAFKRRFRMARLTFLLQRALLVIIGSVTSSSLKSDLSRLGMGLVLCVCVMYFVYTVTLRPYARAVENIYGSTHQIILVMVAIVGLVGKGIGGDAIPLFISVPIAIIVVSAPLVALVVGLFQSFRKDCEREERLQRRLHRDLLLMGEKGGRGNTATNANAAGGGNDGVRGKTAEPRRKSAKSSPRKYDGENATRAILNRVKRSPTVTQGSLVSCEVPSEVEQRRLSGVVNKNQKCNSSSGPNSSNSYQDDDKNDDGAHCNMVIDVASQPRERETNQEFASEPTLENEPLDVVGGRDFRECRADSFVESVSSLSPPSSDNDLSSEMEVAEAEDDYLNDTRVFHPDLYFRSLNAATYVCRDKKGGSATYSMWKMAPDGIPKNCSVTTSEWLKRGVAEAEARKTEGRGHAEGAAQEHKGQQQQQQQQQRHCANDKGVEPPEEDYAWGPRFVQWLQEWKKVFAGGETNLRYTDVLLRRQELHYSTGFCERPYWLEPTEMQKLTYGVKGGSVPCFSQGENTANATVSPPPGDHTLFRGLLERKRRRYLPLHVPRELDATEETRRDTSTGYDEEGRAKTGENSPWQRLHNNVKRDGALAVDTPSADGEKFSLNPDAVPASDQPPSISGLPDFSLTQMAPRLNFVERNFSMEAKLEDCILSAQQKLRSLPARKPRDLSDHNEELHPTTVFPLRISGNGVDTSDWEAFVAQLLAEVPDPLLEIDSEDELEAGILSTSSEPKQAEMETVGQKWKEEKRSNVDAAEVEPTAGHVTTAECGKKTVEPLDRKPFYRESMSLLRRHFLLSKQLVLAFHQQRARLRALQEAVDYRIAMIIKKYMQVFFFALGFLATLALVMCVCGMLHTESVYFVDGVQRESTVESELLGHRSWKSFTLHCCCISMVNLTPTFPYYVHDAEEWMCDNGRVKERVRRDGFFGTVVSGYSVRDLCGMEFKNGCEVTVGEDNQVLLQNCNETVTGLEVTKW